MYVTKFRYIAYSEFCDVACACCKNCVTTKILIQNWHINVQIINGGKLNKVECSGRR